MVHTRPWRTKEFKFPVKYYVFLQAELPSRLRVAGLSNKQPILTHISVDKFAFLKFNLLIPLSLIVALFLSFGLVSAVPVGHKVHAVPVIKAHPALSCPANRMASSADVFLGYNGFNGTPREPQASKGGELGAVFYIADSVDLAKFFAHGADANKGFVCKVYANAKAWANQPKAWVKTPIKGIEPNKLYLGAVLFASHFSKDILEAGAPAEVYQMGICQDQIKRLGVTVQCLPKKCFDNDHHTRAYDTLKAAWDIQQGR